jgi:hypothetical protein
MVPPQLRLRWGGTMFLAQTHYPSREMVLWHVVLEG